MMIDTEHSSANGEKALALLECAMSLLVLLPLLLAGIALYSYMGSNRQIDSLLEHSIFDNRRPLLEIQSTGLISVNYKKLREESERIATSIGERLALTNTSSNLESRYLVEVFSVLLSIDRTDGHIAATGEPVLQASVGGLAVELSDLADYPIDLELDRLQEAQLANGASSLAVPLAVSRVGDIEYAPNTIVIITRLFLKEQSLDGNSWLKSSRNIQILGRVRSAAYSGFRFSEEDYS